MPSTSAYDPIPSTGEEVGCLHASKASFRFLILLFNCLLTFGSYFCFDMPSVLQEQFTNPLHPNETYKNCTTIDGPKSLKNDNTTFNCISGFGLNDTQYNLLYSVYAWTNALVVVGAGYLIDKLGNRIGVFLFSSLCVIGTSFVAIGAMLKSHAAMFPLMLLGRILFGSGNGSLTIVQNRITAYWFQGKELAFAFGCTLAFSRLGSVLNFLLTEQFEENNGMVYTLWGGAILCGLGFIAAIVVSTLDILGLKQLQQTADVKSESKKLRFTDIKYFSSTYWFLALAIMFFYNGVFPFVADASKFIQDTQHISKKDSAYMAGAVYDVSMVLAPFLGTLVDRFGFRGFLATSCAVLTIPVFGILAFAPHVTPLFPLIWLGVTYSFAASSLWPSIPLVVNTATVGTAMGLTTSIQMIGIGICNLIVGKILDSGGLHKWKYVMVFLFANTLACVAMTVLVTLSDLRKGGKLNQSKKQRLHEDPYLGKAVAEYTEKDDLLYDKNSVIN